jgi:hypothetical protein
MGLRTTIARVLAPPRSEFPIGDSPGDATAVLARVVEEALALQAEAEELIAEIRDEGPLAELAPRGGPLISRFLQLRGKLPTTSNSRLAPYVERLDSIFHHHAMLLNVTLDTLSVNWRSERMREQLHGLDGLGQPAEWLSDIAEDLLPAG